ncbi:MAG: hypothetical protein H0T73_13310 [Ardenticatenales bacterium]|nr:hypothetical protein [Ardenticatenales bacterium]
MHNVRRRFAALARLAGTLFFFLVFLPVAIPLAGVAIECRVFQGEDKREATTPVALPPEVMEAREGLVDYERPEDQTYLTFPEWYIVYSSDEYAAFIKDNRPSRFPYFGAIRQHWQSYYEICKVTRDQYPLNTGYHLSLVVTGSSFTVENVLKGIYENTVGRLTEWTSSGEPTQEDVYAQGVAEEYGTFLHTIPWYEFPFKERLDGLWRETDAWGPNPIRKWERKLALSVEYGLKAGYGWLIRQGTQSVYGTEILEIQLWAEGLTDRVVRQEPEIRVVKRLPPRGAIAALPRYEPFTELVPDLVARGVTFVEIAGNDEILITAFAPAAWEYELEQGTFLFALPILTEPERQRVAIKVPVQSLHTILKELEQQDVELEHLYDY